MSDTNEERQSDVQDVEFSRADIESNIEAEAEANVLVEEIGSKEGDITLDDLRKLPGADKYDDAALQAMWDEAQKETEEEGGDAKSTEQQAAESVAAATGGEAVETPRGWKVYDDKGNE